jgi:hypothetical protein
MAEAEADEPVPRTVHVADTLLALGEPLTP